RVYYVCITCVLRSKFRADSGRFSRGTKTTDGGRKRSPHRVFRGGAERARTADLVNAIQASGASNSGFLTRVVYYMCITGTDSRGRQRITVLRRAPQQRLQPRHCRLKRLRRVQNRVPVVVWYTL